MSKRDHSHNIFYLGRRRVAANGAHSPLIRPPEPPSKEWLALRSATHSGDEPFVPSSDDDGANDGEDVQEMELFVFATTNIEHPRP